MSRKRDVYTVTRTSTTDGEFAEQIAGTEGVSRARLAVYAPYIDQAYSSPDQQVEGLGAACLDPRASLTYTTRMDISEREIGSFEDMDDLATEMGDAEEREGEYGQNAVLSRLEIWERTTDKLEDILRTRCIDDRDTERDGRVSGEYWEPEIRAVRIDDRAQSKMAAECVEFLQANDTQLEQYYREHQHEPGVTRGTVHDDVAEYIFSGDDAEPSSFRDFAQECDERNGISSRGAQGQLFNIDGPTLRVTAK